MLLLRQLACGCGGPDPCCTELTAEALLLDTVAQFDGGLVSVAKAALDADSQPESLLAKRADWTGRRTPWQEADEDELGGKVQFFTFTLLLEARAHRPFQVDLSEGPFQRISRIDPSGAIAKYNRSAPESHQLMVGDFLVAAYNPETGGRPAQFRRSYFSDEGGEFRVSISRPNDIFLAVCEQQPDELLGLDVTYHEDNQSVVVRHIMADSLIERYNKSVGLDLRIRKHDHIVSVCGKKGSAELLVKALRDNRKLSLHISRPLVPGPGVS